MLDKHKAQNEAWLKARAEENDEERKEICKLKVNFFKVTYNCIHNWRVHLDSFYMSCGHNSCSNSEISKMFLFFLNTAYEDDTTTTKPLLSKYSRRKC